MKTCARAERRPWYHATMSVHSDLLQAATPDLEALHASIQESKREALAAVFSSPDLAARIRAQVQFLDDSFETIATRPVRSENTLINEGTFPPTQTLVVRVIEPDELQEDDVEDSTVVVTIRNSRVIILLEKTTYELVDLG